MNELISVIIPVYNVEKYLSRCLESVLRQTYKQLEIILVDDGATDNSLEICNKYAARDERIKVFHKENEGLGLTRNYGIKKATGRYVAFIDSDDFIVDDAIQVMYEKAEETGVDLVVASSFYKNEPRIVLLEERIYEGTEVKDVLLTYMMGNLPKSEDMLSVSAWSKLYRLDLISKYNLEFPSERKLIWEDIVFNMEYLLVCNKVYISHKSLYNYCFNGESITHQYKPNKLELVMHMYNYMYEKIEQIKLPDEAKLRLQNNFIGHIRTCLKLEVYYAKQNGKDVTFNHINELCNHKDVQKLLNEYPITYYSFIQKIYSSCILKKKIHSLYFLTWIQNKRKRIE